MQHNHRPAEQMKDLLIHDGKLYEAVSAMEALPTDIVHHSHYRLRGLASAALLEAAREPEKPVWRVSPVYKISLTSPPIITYLVQCDGAEEIQVSDHDGDVASARAQAICAALNAADAGEKQIRKPGDGLTVLLDNEWRAALKWRQDFLHNKDELGSLDSQIVCYLVAEIEGLRERHEPRMLSDAGPLAGGG